MRLLITVMLIQLLVVAVPAAMTPVTETSPLFHAPSVQADRERGEVLLQARTSEMAATEPVEFLLISTNSGHDYEALAITPARPSDLHAALRFIGIPSGEGVDYKGLRLWPRGERVDVAVRVADTEGNWIPAGLLVVRSPDEESLPDSGFVFTGSCMVDEGGVLLYEADVHGPNSLISLYNEPQTVLDVPWQAPQGQVYGEQTLNPAYTFEADTALEFRFRHRPSVDGARSVDLSVRVQVGPDTETGASTEFIFDVAAPESRRTGPIVLQELLDLIFELKRNRHDLYLNLVPDDGVTLGELQELYAFVSEISSRSDVRISPPEPGEMYYQAFLPNPDYREREKRPQQPWELTLYDTPQGSTGVLVRVREVWGDDGEDVPKLETDSYSAGTPDDLRAELARHPTTLKVVLIFCSSELHYGELKRWYGALQPEYKTVYFYTVEPTLSPSKELNNDE